MQENGKILENVGSRIRCGWIKWPEVIGVLNNNEISIKVKAKFYKTVVGLTMMYEFECRAISKKKVIKMKVVEMRMFSWMFSVTWKDKRIKLEMNILDKV